MQILQIKICIAIVLLAIALQSTTGSNTKKIVKKRHESRSNNWFKAARALNQKKSDSIQKSKRELRAESIKNWKKSAHKHTWKRATQKHTWKRATQKHDWKRSAHKHDWKRSAHKHDWKRATHKHDWKRSTHKHDWKRAAQKWKRQTPVTPPPPPPDQFCINIKCVYNYNWHSKAEEMGYGNGSVLLDLVLEEAQRLFRSSDLGYTIKLESAREPIWDNGTAASNWATDGNRTWLTHGYLLRYIDYDVTTLGHVNHYAFFTFDEEGDVNYESTKNTMCTMERDDQQHKVSLTSFYRDANYTGGLFAMALGEAIGLDFDYYEDGGPRLSSMGDDCQEGGENVMDDVGDGDRNAWSACSKEGIVTFHNTSEFCLDPRAQCKTDERQCFDTYPECPEKAYMCNETGGPITYQRFIHKFKYIDCPKTCGTCCTDKVPEMCCKCPCKCQRKCSGEGEKLETCMAEVALFNDSCSYTCNACPEIPEMPPLPE